MLGSVWGPDLTKAFDCINHNILLQKLDCYGIRGGAHEWIESFLCSRTQQVHVNDTLSSKGIITIGVPILGPSSVVFHICE